MCKICKDTVTNVHKTGKLIKIISFIGIIVWISAVIIYGKI